MNKKNISNISFGVASGLWLLFLLTFNFNNVLALDFLQGFSQSEELQVGMIVSVESKDGVSEFVPTNTNNEYALAGVVQNSEKALLVANGEDSTGAIATSGSVSAFVSDINGEIKAGDMISASWIDGVGMKLNEGNNRYIIGIALEDMDMTEGVIVGNINTPDGIKDNVRVNGISIRIAAVSTAAAEIEEVGFFQSITGKNISNLRVIAGLSILVLGIIIGLIVIVSSIRSSFISFGRNPLASGSIYVGLAHSSVLGVGLVLISTIIAYVLWVI